MSHSLPATPPLEGLHAVLAAAQSGSFSAAATALGITHGAISRRVVAVETWLGTAVFDRHGRGVRLTPAGQRFARQVEQALAQIEQTAERWRPRRGSTTLRLSVVPSFARLWLMPRFTALSEMLPGVWIDLLVDHRPVDLVQREADVAIRYGRGGWPGVEHRCLFDETLIPAASPDLAAKIRSSPATDDLLAWPLLHDSNTSQWRDWFGDRGEHYRLRARDRRFEDYDLVLAAAEASLGITLLRLPLAQSWLHSGRLVAISTQSRRNPLSHYLAWRRGDDRSSAAKLVDALGKLPT